MEYFPFVLGAISALIESWLLFFILSSFLGEKNKPRIYFYIIIILDTVLLQFMNYNTDKILIPAIIIIVYEMIASSLIINGGKKVRLFLIVLENCLVFVINMLIIMLLMDVLKISLADIDNLNLINSILSFTSKLFLCAVIAAIIYFSERKGWALPKKLSYIYWIPVFSIVFLFIIVNYIRTSELNQLVNSANLLQFMVLGLFFLNIFAFFIYNKLSENETNKLKLYSMMQQSLYFEELKKSYIQTIAMKHDFEKHMFVINALKQEGKFDKLEKYIEELNLNLQKGRPYIFTKNTVIDSILSAKYNEASEKKITFQVMPTEPLEDEIGNSFYLCILIGNALENAIEACERYKEIHGSAYIKVKVERESEISSNRLIFSVSNSCIIPKEKGTLFGTSKKDNINHGFGLKNMEEAVQKMGGIFMYGYDKDASDRDIFTFVSEIPL